MFKYKITVKWVKLKTNIVTCAHKHQLKYTNQNHITI